MLFDAKLLMSNKQAITATAASSDVIDTGQTKDIGKGGDIPLAIQVTEAFNNLTSLSIDIQTSVDSAFTAPITLATMVIGLAGLTAGAKAPIITLPQGLKRYIRMNYTVTGTAPTTGRITAGVVAGVQTNG
ncbi:Bbp16 family capsid cement protein [Pseudomonas sp. RIT-To-2]|uniref:Bbp16 family capsid cement protein n=1 Tax=Pseudomonas sp. RIT-To-2 TaxID=3462541 RepID=UPI0024132916